MATVKIEEVVSSSHVAELICDELFNAFESEDAQRWEFLPYAKPRSSKDFLGFIQSLAREGISPYVVSTESAEDSQKVGLICLMPINPASGVFEIGHVFLTKSALRSSGSLVGVNAIYLLLKHCFENQARRVQWRCHHMNIASQRLASYLGFTKEGVFRKADFYKGMNRDTVWFSIVDDEWPSISSKLRGLLNT